MKLLAALALCFSQSLQPVEFVVETVDAFGQPLGGVPVVLEMAPNLVLPVSGVVRGHARVRTPDVQSKLTAHLYPASDFGYPSSAGREAKCNAEGRFEFVDLPRGRYLSVLRSASGSAPTIELLRRTNIEVDGPLIDLGELRIE